MEGGGNYGRRDGRRTRHGYLTRAGEAGKPPFHGKTRGRFGEQYLSNKGLEKSAPEDLRPAAIQMK